ncbi:MAG TPA: hypothetical protein DCK79_06160 [Candidatus Atribacteria bacterium]|nr:hypothetical protein [Candidatus Atribacteria bacterium]
MYSFRVKEDCRRNKKNSYCRWNRNKICFRKKCS